MFFSSRFSRASLEGISFNFFVCFIFNVSPKRKNIDIQRNTRVGLGCKFTSNLLSCHHMYRVKICCDRRLMAHVGLYIGWPGVQQGTGNGDCGSLQDQAKVIVIYRDNHKL